MSNSEKISAYLENELSSEEKISFEKELENNSELRQEFDLQQSIVEGIKTARRQELKAMLDNVPVGGAGVTGTITFGKVASIIAVLGIISYGVYHFTTPEEQLMPTKTYEEEIAVEPSDVTDDKDSKEIVAPVQKPQEQVFEEEAKTDQSPKLKTNNSEPVESLSDEPEINRPSAAPMFETSGSDSLEAPTDNIVNGINGRSSTVDVEIDNSKRKFSFHYQFADQKLHLYGNFNKDLYEILEFKTSSKKALFLYYKDDFYPLEKNQVQITKLEPVKEPSLIEKLEKLIDKK